MILGKNHFFGSLTPRDSLKKKFYHTDSLSIEFKDPHNLRGMQMHGTWYHQTFLKDKSEILVVELKFLSYQYQKKKKKKKKVQVITLYKEKHVGHNVIVETR